MRAYYVYIYFRPWNGQPCYVGKGFGKRWLHHETLGSAHTNKHFSNIFKKAGGPIPRVKIQEDLTEDVAYDLERLLIKIIGRQEHGGPLVNLTDGGDGLRNPSKEVRSRIAAATSIRCAGEGNPFFGKRHTDEANRKNREAHLGKTSPMKGIKGPAHHWFGKAHSEETKVLIGNGSRGKSKPQTTRDKISVAVSKRMQDPVIKDKHLRAQRLRRAREKAEKECFTFT